MNTTLHSPLDAVAPILDAYRSGMQTLLVSGRSLADLHVNEQGEIRPLRHTLVRRAFEEFGMGTMLFNLALGPRWCWDGLDERQRREYESKLVSGLPIQDAVRNDLRRSGHELALSFLSSIQQTIERNTAMPPALIFMEFGEDIFPDSERGCPSDFLMQMNELVAIISADYRKRRLPLLLAVSGTPERMDRRVVGSLSSVHLQQPERDEKLAFIQSLSRIPSLNGAHYESGLDDLSMANLTTKMPNQSLEEAFLESAKTGKPITHARIVERKKSDVIALSEGTLSPLDVDRIKGVRLAGRTLDRVRELLQLWAQGLKTGNTSTPMNIILAGAASTAKTDLALITALLSQTPAYSLYSPKGSLVGQTEKNVRLQFRIFKELYPAIGVIDEITEAFQMERGGQNLDSGASAAVVAEMLSALSDSSRAGKTILIGTTNLPHKVSSAMASRFVFVPVLSALEDDYADILCAVLNTILPNADCDPSDQKVVDASRVFHRKGASPRIMRTMIASKLSTGVSHAPGELLTQAAADCAPQHPRDRAGAEYADLFAISVCTDLSMLPWHGRITNYPLPQYLRNIVSEMDGSVDIELLTRRIEQLKPHVNV